MKILNGNQIKIIACIFMLIDHIGVFIFPNILILRIIGRLAMPLFAFFIAEGAYYTKNKIKYLSLLSITGLIIFFVVFIATKEIEINILISFSLSLIVIFLYDNIMKYIKLKNKKLAIISALSFIIYSISLFIFIAFYHIEYGIFSIILPFAISLTQSKHYKNPNPSDNLIKALVFILAYIFSMIISFYKMAPNMPLNIQKYGIFAVFFILLYNGKRGKYNLKYLFYIFYPAHVLILYLISYFM